MTGLHLLGVDTPRMIQIRVKNAQALAAREGGMAGAVAAQLVPDTIEQVVLDKMVEQFRATLAQRGVDAEIKVVSAAQQQPEKKGLGPGGGFVLGAGLVGGAWALMRHGARLRQMMPALP